MLAVVFALVMYVLYCALVLLGFVSSLIRNLTYFDNPGMYHNSMEDRLQRSKRLGAMRIIVGEVANNKKGSRRIVFVPAGIGRRVEKEQWYK